MTPGPLAMSLLCPLSPHAHPAGGRHQPRQTNPKSSMWYSPQGRTESPAHSGHSQGHPALSHQDLFFRAAKSSLRTRSDSQSEDIHKAVPRAGAGLGGGTDPHGLDKGPAWSRGGETLWGAMFPWKVFLRMRRVQKAREKA